MKNRQNQSDSEKGKRLKREKDQRELKALTRQISALTDPEDAANYVKRVNNCRNLDRLHTNIGFAQTCEGRIIDMESFMIPTNANNGKIYTSLETNTKIFSDKAHATRVSQRLNIAIQCIYSAAKRACTEQTWKNEIDWVKVIERYFYEDVHDHDTDKSCPRMIIGREVKGDKNRIDIHIQIFSDLKENSARGGTHQKQIFTLIVEFKRYRECLEEKITTLRMEELNSLVSYVHDDLQKQHFPVAVMLIYCINRDIGQNDHNRTTHGMCFPTAWALMKRVSTEEEIQDQFVSNGGSMSDLSAGGASHDKAVGATEINDDDDDDDDDDDHDDDNGGAAGGVASSSGASGGRASSAVASRDRASRARASRARGRSGDSSGDRASAGRSSSAVVSGGRAFKSHSSSDPAHGGRNSDGGSLGGSSVLTSKTSGSGRAPTSRTSGGKRLPSKSPAGRKSPGSRPKKTTKTKKKPQDTRVVQPEGSAYMNESHAPDLHVSGQEREAFPTHKSQDFKYHLDPSKLIGKFVDDHIVQTSKDSAWFVTYNDINEMIQANTFDIWTENSLWTKNDVKYNWVLYQEAAQGRWTLCRILNQSPFTFNGESGIQFSLVTHGHIPSEWGVVIVRVYETQNGGAHTDPDREHLMPCPRDGYFVRTIKKEDDETGLGPFPETNASDWGKKFDEKDGGCITARMFVMNTLSIDYDDIYYINKEVTRNNDVLQENKDILQQIKDQNIQKHLSSLNVNRYPDGASVQGRGKKDSVGASQNGAGVDEDTPSSSSSWVGRGDNSRKTNPPVAERPEPLIPSPVSTFLQEEVNSLKGRIEKLTKERDDAIIQQNKSDLLFTATISKHAERLLIFEEQEKKINDLENRQAAGTRPNLSRGDQTEAAAVETPGKIQQRFESEKNLRRAAENELHLLKNVQVDIIAARQRETIANKSFRLASNRLSVVEESNKELQSQISKISNEKDTLVNSHTKIVSDLEKQLHDKDHEITEANLQHEAGIQELTKIHNQEIQSVNNKHENGQKLWFSQHNINTENVAKLEELRVECSRLESHIKDINAEKNEKNNTLATTLTQLQGVQQQLSSLSQYNIQLKQEILDSNERSNLMAQNNVNEMGEKNDQILFLETKTKELQSQNNDDASTLKHTLTELKTMQKEHTMLIHSHRVSLALAARMRKTPLVDSLMHQMTGLEENLHNTKVSLAHMESDLDDLKLIHAQCPAQPNVTGDPHTVQGTDDAREDQDTEDQNQDQCTDDAHGDEDADDAHGDEDADDAHGDEDAEDLYGGQGTEGLSEGNDSENPSGGQSTQGSSGGQGTDHTTQEVPQRLRCYGSKPARSSDNNYAVQFSDAAHDMYGNDTQDTQDKQ